MWDTIAQWFSQFLVLTWKNLKLKFKAKKALIAEIIAPILFFMFWVSFMGTDIVT